MVEKFEIDSSVSKEEILKEFQALDVVSQHEGAVESMAERVARVKDSKKMPLVMVIMISLTSLVVLGILVVIISKYAGNVQKVEGVKVPAVVGKTSSAARQMINDADLRPVESIIPSTQPKGIVVSTKPTANTELKKGSTVTMEVSGGK
ncbi:MAG: PASTA domain-containing protein [bacterium]